MGFWRDIFGPEVPEQRMITSLAGIERPGSNLLQVYGLGDVTLPAVTIESALTVPAVWAAVSFLSRTLAALPLHAFRKADDGPEKIAGGLETLIHEAPNPEWTSFKLRQHFWQQVFTGGRGLLYIERSGSNIVGLWPIDPSNVQIKRSTTGQTTYHVGGKVYSAANVIDISFMLRADGLGHYGPIAQGALAIQLALAMNSYGSSFFAGGGIPPLALTGPLPAGPEAMRRALADVQRAIDAARESGKPIVNIPPGYELKPIGLDPDKGQMTDGRRFQVEEIARIYNLPPVFLQDLTRATFTNAEQQDLHLVKHLIGQWAEALEEEMNLKLFGQRNGGRYVEHNLDGLLRGDFKTRMEGLARSIQSGIRTPNEARQLENLPDHDDPAANDLHMQGATLPIGTQPDNSGTPPPADGGTNDDGA
jgi:HK97 family phage portal protein